MSFMYYLSECLRYLSGEVKADHDLQFLSLMLNAPSSSAAEVRLTRSTTTDSECGTRVFTVSKNTYQNKSPVIARPY